MYLDSWIYVSMLVLVDPCSQPCLVGKGLVGVDVFVVVITDSLNFMLPCAHTYSIFYHLSYTEG